MILSLEYTGSKYNNKYSRWARKYYQKASGSWIDLGVNQILFT